MISRERSETIEICGLCQGDGSVVEHEETADHSYHKPDYLKVNRVCGVCKGAGRVRVRVTREVFVMGKF